MIFTQCTLREVGAKAGLVVHLFNGAIKAANFLVRGEEQIRI